MENTQKWVKMGSGSPFCPKLTKLWFHAAKAKICTLMFIWLLVLNLFDISGKIVLIIIFSLIVLFRLNFMLQCHSLLYSQYMYVLFVWSICWFVCLPLGSSNSFSAMLRPSKTNFGYQSRYGSSTKPVEF